MMTDASWSAASLGAGGGASRAARPWEETDLEQLMASYQQGDPQAAAELVRRLSPRLLAFLAGSELTRSYAEDFLQECWLRIHRARRSYRPGAPVLPWIFAIARHSRIDGYRHLRRGGLFRELPLDAQTDRACQPSFRDQEIDLRRFIARLPESQQEVVLMLKVAGMSLDEVASAIGSTVAAVKQKAHRAYDNLRAMSCASWGA